MRKNLCGAVIAGGGSSRMGTDKAKLPLGDETALERVVNELLKTTDTVVINQNNNQTFEGIPIISDIIKDSGPLGGLHAIMMSRLEEWFLLSACDTPFIDRRIIHFLADQRTEERQAIIPVVDGQIHPLAGLYHSSILPTLVDLLQAGERKVKTLLDQINTYYVDDFDTYPESVIDYHFFNMNTPSDYEKAQEMIKNQSSSRHSF